MRPALLLAPALLLSCTGETGVDEIPDEPVQPHLALTIDSPAPATWHAEGTVDVTGTVETLTDLRLQGGPVTASDGAWGAPVTLERGTNRIQVEGTSPGGTLYGTHVSVIAGDTIDPDAPVRDGASLRLNRGGLDLVLDLAAAQLDEATLRELLITGEEPLYTYDQDGTRVDVAVTDLGLGGVDIDVEPGPGTADLTVTLTDLSLSLFAEGTSGALFFEVAESLTVDRAELVGTLGVAVVDGEIRTTLTDVDVRLVGFRVDLSDWPSWIQGTFTDLLLTEVVEGALRTAVAEVVPPLVDEQLNSLDLSYEIELLETPIRVEATLTDAAIDPDGLALATDLAVDMPAAGAVDAPGALASPEATPVLDTTSDLAVGLADELLNVAAYQAWRADLLTYTLSTDEGTLPAYVLDALGGARTGRVAISADLPPTIVAREGGLRAQVGELRVRLDTIGGDRGEYVILAAGGHIDLDLEVVDGVLQVGFGEKDLVLAVRDTDWEGSLVEVTDQVADLVPLELALSLLEDLTFPLPTFAGVGIQGATVVRDAGDAHSNLAVRLSRVEE
jgi:hypothetical protein